MGWIFPQQLEGTSLADTFIVDFWSPELQENKFPLFSATQVVVICHRELIHMEYIFSILSFSTYLYL